MKFDGNKLGVVFIFVLATQVEAQSSAPNVAPPAVATPPASSSTASGQTPQAVSTPSTTPPSVPSTPTAATSNPAPVVNAPKLEATSPSKTESATQVDPKLSASMQRISQERVGGAVAFFELLKNAGFVVWLIIFVSILVMSLALERWLAYRLRYGGIKGSHLFKEVKKYWLAGDFKRAIEVCRQYPNVPVARVLAAGLQNHEKGIEVMDIAMEAEALHFAPKIQARLGYVASFANIGLLLGLLGTIGGLIQAFSAAGGAGMIGTGRELELAAGIGQAMLATFMGLGVAIPALFFHQYLSTIAYGIIDDMQEFATALKQLTLQISGKAEDRQELAS